MRTNSRGRTENWLDELDRQAVDESVCSLIERLGRRAPSRKLNALYSIRRAVLAGRLWLTERQRQDAIAAMSILVDSCKRGVNTGCGVLSDGGRNHCFACTRSRRILARERAP